MVFLILCESFGANFLCNKIPGLTKKQREICESAPDALAAIGSGTRLGISECQNQFRFSRWNCTPIETEHVFGYVSVLGSREAAFLYAISSAGVTYAITQACARGNISSCGCAPPTTISTAAAAAAASIVPGLKGNGGGWGVASGWRWGGCSADVDFGVKLARRFLDAKEIEGDARSLMNLHNNKAGRKAVQKTVQTECKCHGVSGSCTLKTCWLKLANFRKVGEAIMKKYRKAKSVVAVHPRVKAKQLQQRKRRSSLTLRVKSRRRLSFSKRSHSRRSRGGGRPRRSDLVFLESSPSYCDVNATVGSLGTKGRRCMRRTPGTRLNSTLSESDCQILCCGRGYSTHQMWHRWKCHCKFRWCCEVECQNCQERVEIYTCN